LKGKGPRKNNFPKNTQIGPQDVVLNKFTLTLKKNPQAFLKKKFKNMVYYFFKI
jgi:hypothetical protein